MWALYADIARRYERLTLAQERRLIAKAQGGAKESTDEIVLRHVGFVMFRLRTVVYPEVLVRLGDDLLADAILVLYDKVHTYDLRYRDRNGERKRVRFSSYIWKRIDGFIIDSLNRAQRYVQVEDIDSATRDARYARSLESHEDEDERAFQLSLQNLPARSANDSPDLQQGSDLQRFPRLEVLPTVKGASERIGGLLES